MLNGARAAQFNIEGVEYRFESAHRNSENDADLPLTRGDCRK
jgi:hypothetical protein